MFLKRLQRWLTRNSDMAIWNQRARQRSTKSPFQLHVETLEDRYVLSPCDGGICPPVPAFVGDPFVVGVPDRFTVAEDHALVGNVSFNDPYTGYAPGPGGYGAYVVTNPLNGSLSSDNFLSGWFEYTPNADFSGVDAFTYQPWVDCGCPYYPDGRAYGTPTTVTIVVTPQILDPRIVVTPTSGLVTTEAGGTDTFEVVLNVQPLAVVAIPIYSYDTSEGTVSTNRLIFTPDNWATPQTVTVTGVDDTSDDGDVPYYIIVGPSDSLDPRYDGMYSYVSVTNEDNDVPVPDDALVYTIYHSANVPQAIYDYSTVYSTLTISDSYVIGDLNIQFDITHTYDGDLYADLIGPDGTYTWLFSNVGGDGDNFTGTILNDEADYWIAYGDAPFSGSYQPDWWLSAFDGKNVNGEWTLAITDVYGGDIGQLNSWSLQVGRTPPAPASSSSSTVSTSSSSNAALVSTLDKKSTPAIPAAVTLKQAAPVPVASSASAFFTDVDLSSAPTPKVAATTLAVLEPITAPAVKSLPLTSPLLKGL